MIKNTMLNRLQISRLDRTLLNSLKNFLLFFLMRPRCFFICGYFGLRAVEQSMITIGKQGAVTVDQWLF